MSLPAIAPAPAFLDCEDDLLAWGGPGSVLVTDQSDIPQERATLVIRGFHGTTHDFTEFEALKHGCADSWFGRVSYFSSCEDDSATNYLADGPDLTARIEMRAEWLLANSEREELGIPEWLSDADAETALAARVRREMTGATPQVLECALRMTNPFIIGRRDTLLIDGEPATDNIYAKAREDVLAKHGLDPEADIYDLENGGEIEGEIHDFEDRLLTDLAEDVTARVTRALDAARAYAKEDLVRELVALILEPDMTADGLDNTLRTTEPFIYLDHRETGDLVSHDFIGHLIGELGYDGIILLNADRVHNSIYMAYGTAHYQVADQHSGNIRILSRTAYPEQAESHSAAEGGEPAGLQEVLALAG